MLAPDHVFFEYTKKHNSDAVCDMFRGFSGHIVADAHCIYDALYRGDALLSPDDKPPLEVACWAHLRRKAWEAAVAAKDPVAREALLRIRMLFKLEERWAALSPKQRLERRQRAARPLVDRLCARHRGPTTSWRSRLLPRCPTVTSRQSR